MTGQRSAASPPARDGNSSRNGLLGVTSRRDISSTSSPTTRPVEPSPRVAGGPTSSNSSGKRVSPGGGRNPGSPSSPRAADPTVVTVISPLNPAGLTTVSSSLTATRPGRDPSRTDRYFRMV